VAVFERVGDLLQSRVTLWVAAGVALALTVLTARWMGWLTSPWLWALLTFLAAIGVFAAFYWGIPKLRERRFLHQEGSQHVIGSGDSPEEYRAKFAKALQALAALPQLKGSTNPLYELPWYLLLGGSDSGKTSAVRASGLFTPLFKPTRSDGPTMNYEWCVSKTAVVLDTPSRYAEQTNVEQDRAEWYRLLLLLRQHRDREPLNGVVVVIGADALATEPEDSLRATASMLRDRVEEAIQKLGSDVPLYVLVTKCDRVEGFSEFFAKLPAQVTNEVIGYVDETAATHPTEKGRGVHVIERLETALESMYQRLHFFRAALLDGSVPEALRPAIFCFPEEFRALQRSLIAFSEPLLTDAVKYHTPLFRGIFFSSARQAQARVSRLRRTLNLGDTASPGSEAGGPHFLADLFTQILPRDRGLVGVTPEARRKRGLLRGVSTVVVAVLLVTAAAVVAREYFIDQRIVASADSEVCLESTGPGSTTHQLVAADRCRQAVETLASRNAQRSTGGTRFFGRSVALEHELRERYLAYFHQRVLASLNHEMDRVFTATDDPLPLMILAARRIQLERRCLSATGCTKHQLDEWRDEYRTMLVPSGDRRAPPDDEALLAQTYTAYVLWQRDPKEDLREDVANDEKRLQQWLSTKQFGLDTLLPLVNKQSPAITYDDYWKLPSPISERAPQIAASCTKEAWDDVVAPLLQQLQDAVPNVAQKLRDFQAEYRRACMAQWQQFLTSFTAGIQRWHGADRQQELALELLTPESPCLRVIDDAITNLTPWLPPAGDAEKPPAWAIALREWAASPQRRAYAAALERVHGELEKCPTGDNCIKLVQAVFAEGEPSAQSANPLNQAAWIAQSTHGDANSDGAAISRLLGEPLELVWNVALNQVGATMQERWRQDVVEPLQGLSPAEQLVDMYGPGGKVPAFLEQVVKPDLGGKAPDELAQEGKRVPLSDDFAKMLSTQKELEPILGGSSGPLPVQVEAGPTHIESHRGVRSEQTVLSISCGGKEHRVTNRAEDPSEGTTTVPWSSQTCTDAAVSVYFYPGYGAINADESPPPKQLQLTKRYTGSAGLLQFLLDFEQGTHRFLLDDLSGDPDSLKSGVIAVNVAYHLDLPPELNKVIAATHEPLLPEDIASQS
jgi:type VI secretion system protein ImpL